VVFRAEVGLGGRGSPCWRELVGRREQWHPETLREKFGPEELGKLPVITAFADMDLQGCGGEFRC
jgi:hypothetical protein